MFLLKKYKPTSPGIRHKLFTKNVEFLKIQKHFFFLKSKFNSGGRNNKGSITVRHKKSILVKKKLLLHNILRFNLKLLSIIVGVFKQKHNMCFFGLVKYSNGAFSYIHLSHGLKISNFIIETSYLTKKFEISLGSLYFFGTTYFHLRFFNVCSYLKKKSIYAKAAGVFCKFILKNIERSFIKIQLPSTQFKFLTFDYYCTVGRASNIYSYKHKLGKAGYTRRLGVKPTVRGVAMNPVDHPNGGRTKTNKPEKTPWGKVAKNSK